MVDQNYSIKFEQFQFLTYNIFNSFMGLCGKVVEKLNRRLKVQLVGMINCQEVLVFNKKCVCEYRPRLQIEEERFDHRQRGGVQFGVGSEFDECWSYILVDAF